MGGPARTKWGSVIMGMVAPQYLDLKQLLARLPIGKSKLYADIQRGEFPQPLKFGRKSCWLLNEVEAWEKKIRERRAR